MVSVQEYEEAQSSYDNKVREFISKLKGLKCNVKFQQIKDYKRCMVITTVIIYYYESFEIKPDTKWEELEEFIKICKLYNESDPLMIITNEKIPVNEIINEMKKELNWYIDEKENSNINEKEWKKVVKYRW